MARLEDERAIRDILVAYALHIDAGEWDAWYDLFEPDVHFDTGSGGEPFVGRSGLRTFAAALSSSPAARHHHTTGPHTIRIDGDTAEVDGYSTVIDADGSGFGIMVANRTRWWLVRRDGGWRVARRVVRRLGG